jgi:hypothetical protein
VSLQNPVCVTTNHDDTHGDDTQADVWAAALPDNLPELLDDDTHGPAEWRIEVYSNAQGKLYWRYRKGSGRYKPTIPGGPFETLQDERKEQYHVNADRNRKAKARAQEKRSARVRA